MLSALKIAWPERKNKKEITSEQQA